MKTNLLITLTALIMVGCGNFETNIPPEPKTYEKECIEGVTYLARYIRLGYIYTVMLDTNSKVIRCKND